MATISYIAGQMLQSNLERDGVNLSVDTNLLYLDVGNSLVGINTAVPTVELEVNGNIKANNLDIGDQISATGNVTVGNLTTTGLISADGNVSGNYIFGNGSQLTGIDATSIQNGNSNVKVLANSNVTISINSISNIAVFSTSGLGITGNIVVGNILIPITGNVDVGNVNIANLASPIANSDAATKLYVDQQSGNAAGNVSFDISDGSNVETVMNGDTITFSGTANQATVVVGTTDTVTIGLPTTISVDTIISRTANGNISISPNGTGIVTITAADGGATGIEMGTPTAGSLISNAVTLTTDTSVTNGIAQLNLILGKLVPPAPPNFPGGNSLSITTATTSARMCSGFTQPDNTPGANKAVAAGTLVSAVRVSTYATNTISNTGPGDSGKLTVYFNGVDAGNVTFNTNATPTGNGFHGNLSITNNYDYHVANASITAGFWFVFTASANGVSVPSGWNEVYLGDNSTGNTNTPNWYYDASTASAPVFSNVTVTACVSPTLGYSSTIPHYASGTTFGLGFNVNRLSGNMYPNNGNLLTNSTASGGAFQAPTAISYASANVTVPLAQNLYVSSGNAVGNTTSAIVASGFGSSSTGPSVTVTNSYNSTTQAFTTALANTVLYKNGSSTAIDEGNVIVTSVGTGSGNALRIINPGTGNTPVYTGTEANFNSQSSTLQTYDATVVGSSSQGVLKHDQTNYATGYLPAGPNLSSGRTGTQYFTIKFVRTTVSKFDITYAGNVAGVWVALPGSTIDSTSTANGWIDMTTAYAGSGVPGANIVAGGNGSNGCALGGTIVPNTSVGSTSKTCTFGTVSSSSTATNEIYVRIALTSGQSVTGLSLNAASN